MKQREPDPSAGQTPEEITEYYRNAKVGDAACIRSTAGMLLEFKMSVIEKAASKSRIALRDAYAFGGYGFYVDGRNCKSPGGQGSLVKPTPEIEAWIAKYPRGTFDWVRPRQEPLTGLVRRRLTRGS